MVLEQLTRDIGHQNSPASKPSPGCLSIESWVLCYIRLQEALLAKLCPDMKQDSLTESPHFQISRTHNIFSLLATVKQSRGASCSKTSDVSREGGKMGPKS